MLCTVLGLNAQITQNIKGRIIDQESQMPLIGATIVVLGTNPIMGTVSDVDGYYKISGVKTGRYNIQITYLGYEPVIIPEVMISSGKETIIEIGLTESFAQMEEVEIKAQIRKDKPMNSMAGISARSFTVEETRRYAGGMDDPARMASVFAGVTVGDIQDNAIIIRGNSPKGVLWRLEGVDIPNPNHLANGNVVGGGLVTMISGQLMANSDFYTGAFPAEFGNSLAGVFDMRLRKGNSEKREYTFQAGMLGIDFATEGPFIKGRNSSYLINYRYSTFGLVSDLGLIPSMQIPRYQDLTFKFHFPTKKAGVFTLWGLGGIDRNVEPVDYDSMAWIMDWDRIYYEWDSKMGVTALTHNYILNDKRYIQTVLSLSGAANDLDIDRLNNDLVLKNDYGLYDKTGKASFCSFMNFKFNSRNTNRTGINVNFLFYDLNINSTLFNTPETYRNIVKSKGNSNHIQFYSQSKYHLTPLINIVAGFHAEFFALSEDFTIDPRISFNWDVNSNHSLSFGYGKHSQLEELKIYFISSVHGNDITYPNKSLEFSHAHHFVFAYNWLINGNLRFKVEPYFQYLYNVPGVPGTSYSMLNYKQDWAFSDSLTNCTTGQNVGIDFTLERFLNNNYYYLITASLFGSIYLGDDGMMRNSRYNKNYVLNILFGKEIYLGSERNKALGINGRVNISGGERISPVLKDVSIEQKRIVYDEENAFEEQIPGSYFCDLSLTYRINKANHSSIWALQVKNILGSPYQSEYFYHLRDHNIQYLENKITLPVLSYKIEF